MQEHVQLRPGAGPTVNLQVLDGEVVAWDKGERLKGRAGAVFRLGRHGFVFVDVDRAGNGQFVDVAFAPTLAELERNLRDRAAAQPSHPSSEFDASDALVFERAAKALARSVAEDAPA